ncbi:MAG: hypothetical protein JWP87_4853 [Labilithrix sp.]|nr:hypothetical protein [Labilithrix sp.]
MSAGPRRLSVLVDGAPMAEAEALAFWDRFSAWMEEHRGDLAGFAAQEGFASVHPGVDGDRPVLRASKTAGQRPYVAVRAEAPGGGDRGADAAGGSAARQNAGRKPDRPGSNPRDFTGKRRK